MIKGMIIEEGVVDKRRNEQPIGGICCTLVMTALKVLTGSLLNQ